MLIVKINRYQRDGIITNVTHDFLVSSVSKSVAAVKMIAMSHSRFPRIMPTQRIS